MPFVSVRDIEIYYELTGSGPRLLHLSGTGADLRNKPNVFDSPLADEFEILAFDQRGLGQTSRPDIPYSMAEYALDIVGLLDELNWHPCHVMGISFGGMVAQELAIRAPEYIERLVLSCTSSGGAGGQSYPVHELVGSTPEESNAANIPVYDTRYDTNWQRENPKAYQAMLDESNSRCAGIGEPNREIGAQRQLEARIKHDTYNRLAEIKLPVFIVGGVYDGVAPPRNLEAIQRQIEGSRLEFFHGGHDFYDHDPMAYQRIIDFMLGRLDDR